MTRLDRLLVTLGAVQRVCVHVNRLVGDGEVRIIGRRLTLAYSAAQANDAPRTPGMRRKSFRLAPNDRIDSANVARMDSRSVRKRLGFTLQESGQMQPAAEDDRR